MIFNEQIKTFLLNQEVDKNRISQVTKDDIKKNMTQQATFDFDAVESADLQSVLNGRFGDESAYVIGGIAIPDVSLNLPIFKGVSDYALTFGAGTMKEEQQMGQGNYALASHHMIDQSLLFGPLVNIELGQPIYLTDLEYVYEYTTTFKEYVSPTRVDLIDDVEDKTLVTLVTCDTTGSTRLVVQGELHKKYSVDKASDSVAKAFDVSRNTW